MSCSGAFDIHEGGTYSLCPSKEVCAYDYSYEYDRTSKCRVTKYSKYLKLLCWDRSNVTVANTKNLNLSEARLYSPSINHWNGKQVDAELILSHSGPGKSVDICIPIVKDDSSAEPSVEFFDSINNAVKILPQEKNGTMRTVELPANFSLDNIIPKTSFYLADGDGMDITRCTPSARSIIIFSKNKPMRIKGQVLSNIKKIISAYNPPRRRKITSSKDKNGNDGQFWKNVEGTTKNKSGGGFSPAGQMAMECEPVNNSNTGNNVGIKKNPTVDAADKFSGMNGEEIFHKYVVPVLIFIGACFGLFFIYWFAVPKPYPHYNEKMNAKGKGISRFMYTICNIPVLGKMICGGEEGLARIKGKATGDS